MLHVKIIALGFLAVTAFSWFAFSLAKLNRNTICEVVAATAFGVGIFGFLSAIYIGNKVSTDSKTIIWIGASWMAILNSLLSCLLTIRFDKSQGCSQ